VFHLLRKSEAVRPVVLSPIGRARRGSVVLSYLQEPFLRKDSSLARAHTNWQECLSIAEAWREAGFTVCVIDRKDRRFSPTSETEVVVDLGFNLDRWSQDLPTGCRKIFHATGAHWQIQNAAERRRLDLVRERRGVSLKPRRQGLEHRGAEAADLITVLGNEFTAASYEKTAKPVHRVPISSAYEFSWPATRDFTKACRRFLWMGSFGMVHKGLDLVLEAFAAMPDLELTVCGRPEKEEDFFSAYRRELSSFPNIKLAGWVDPSSPQFETLRREHAAMVYPSCSEGGGGTVIHAMHAGLLPVVTRAASVDIGDFGSLIGGESPADVAEAVRAVADLPSAALEERARAAFEYARAHHTLAEFGRNYRRFAAHVIEAR